MNSLEKHGKNFGWAEIGSAWAELAADSVAVIGMRCARLARGGKPARDEFSLMISEKVDAHGRFARDLVTGRAGCTPRAVTGSALSFYGKKVRANRTRLSKARD
jgi:hypothetical protein